MELRIEVGVADIRQPLGDHGHAHSHHSVPQLHSSVKSQVQGVVVLCQKGWDTVGEAFFWFSMV